MALDVGLGVTPWSPLPSGVLSGKYTRENAKTVKADRGERVTQFLKSANMSMHAGATVNGEKSPFWPLVPTNDAER